MKKRAITIQDVARAMSVSVTTVSFVLNGKSEGRVSPKVAQRIIAYADRVGYRPHARSKRKSGRTKLYGVLVEDIRSSFQQDLVFHMQQLFSENGAEAVVMSLNGDRSRAFSVAKTMGSLELSGYFFMALASEEQQGDASLWRGPVVLWDAALSGAATLSPDYRQLVQKILFDTIQEDRLERIAMVCCASDAFISSGFVAGYMETMDRLQKDVVVKKLPYHAVDTETYALLAEFMRDNKNDTLVFSNDRLARLAVQLISDSKDTTVRCVVSPSYINSAANLKCVVLPLDAESWAQEIVSRLIL